MEPNEIADKLYDELKKESEELLMPFAEILTSKGYSFIISINHPVGVQCNVYRGNHETLLGLAEAIHITQRVSFLKRKDQDGKLETAPTT